MCLVRFAGSDGGIRIRASRLYDSRAAAEKRLPKKSEKKSLRESMGSLMYWH